MLLKMLGNISCTSWTINFMRKDWKEKQSGNIPLASGAVKKPIRTQMLASNPGSVRKPRYSVLERRTFKILESCCSLDPVFTQDLFLSDQTQPSWALLFVKDDCWDRRNSYKLSCDLVLHVSHEGSNINTERSVLRRAHNFSVALLRSVPAECSITFCHWHQWVRSLKYFLVFWSYLWKIERKGM